MRGESSAARPALAASAPITGCAGSGPNAARFNFAAANREKLRASPVVKLKSGPVPNPGTAEKRTLPTSAWKRLMGTGRYPRRPYPGARWSVHREFRTASDVR